MDKKITFLEKDRFAYLCDYLCDTDKQTDWNSVTDRPLDWLTSVDNWHAKIPTISPFMQKS